MLPYLRPSVHRVAHLQRPSWSFLLKRFASSAPCPGQQHSQGSPEEAKPYSAIPGPKELPFIGNVKDLFKNSSRMIEYYHELCQEYGNIVKLHLPGNQQLVVLSDPDSLETVLRAEGKYPERDKTMTPRMAWFNKHLGYPIPFANESGEAWKQGRLATKNQILPRNVNSYVPGLDQVYVRFIDYLRGARDSSNNIEDFGDLMPKLLTEVSAKFVYDADLHIVSDPKEEDLQFLADVVKLFECMSKLITTLVPTYKVYANQLYRDMESSMKGFRTTGLRYAEKVLAEIEAGQEPGEVRGLLEQWLAEGKMTKDLAIMLAADMFTAGVHTTAHQSTFLIYEMAKRPEIQENLYKEIQSVLGERKPTAEDLERMPYTKGCVMESLRLRPTAGGFSRLLQEDAVLLGYKVPAGTTLIYDGYNTGRNKEIFKEPEEFLPERWSRNFEAKHHPFALLPFGFGPRVCWGKRFAELELKLLAIEMVRNFVVSTDIEDLRTRESLVTVPDEKVTLRLEDRN